MRRAYTVEVADTGTLAYAYVERNDVGICIRGLAFQVLVEIKSRQMDLGRRIEIDDMTGAV